MSIRTRAGALLAGGALVASGLTLAGPTPGAHAADVPSPEAKAAVTWLKAQLTDAGVLGVDASSVSATLDLGTGLARTGVDAGLLTQVTTGIDGVLADFIGTEGDTSRSGRVAKAAAFYAEAANPKDAGTGHVDLIARLEGVVEPSGRLTPSWGDADYFGQSSAVLALEIAGSGETQAATDFLIAGQCENGGWGYFDTSTTPATCVPDVDTTSLAVAALASQEATASQTAVDKGTAWLLSQQAADGSLGLSDFLPYNSNSTGLAAWALGEAGETAAAAKAAAWVASRQLTKLAGCTSVLDPEAGAIAYDATAIADARADREIAAADRPTWVLASAQALAGLAYLSNPVAGRVYGPTGYVRAGTTVTVRSTGLRAGQPACLAGFGNARAIAGPGYAKVTLPAATGNRVLALRWTGGGVTTTIKTLGAKTFRPKVRSTRVKRGRLQVVTVTGLAPAERFTVRYAGRAIRTATATSTGVARVSFRVGRVKGLKSVVVLGQFSNRRGTTTFRVVR